MIVTISERSSVQRVDIFFSFFQSKAQPSHCGQENRTKKERSVVVRFGPVVKHEEIWIVIENFAFNFPLPDSVKFIFSNDGTSALCVFIDN